jgi:3-phosphoshikimate 1-carboxyvinyltransferase
MQYYTVQQSILKGTIAIPPSKSQTLRALLFGLLGKGKTVIHHYLHSPDTSAMVAACRLLGAQVVQTPDTIEIDGLNGNIHGAENVIDAGNSGLVLRFISAAAALSSQPIVITGDHSIRSNRPMQPFLEAVSHLGATAVATRGNGYAPLIIKGKIQPGKVRIHGEDSQPVSSLLIASAFAAGTSEIEVINPGEKPWVALTLSWLERLGIACKHSDYTHYQVSGHASYNGFEYTVPGDLSSVAFPIAAAVLTHSEIIIQNADLSDLQGDKQFIAVLQAMGAQIEIDSAKKQLHVKKGPGQLSGMSLDINDYIDSIAILAVIGCFAEGETQLRNAAIARKKECDRIHCLALELKKMGANITELEDGLIIRHSQLKGAHLYSHRDHRMAMALTVAALAAEGESRIDGVECVGKTYPGFAEHFRLLGANLQYCK